jgi:CBS domain-containing protein
LPALISINRRWQLIQLNAASRGLPVDYIIKPAIAKRQPWMGAYPVESDGRLVGIVSKADALKAFALKQDRILPHYDDVMGTTVEEVMSRHVMTVDPEAKLQRVPHLMEKSHFKSLPVIDASSRLLGMIARKDR